MHTRAKRRKNMKMTKRIFIALLIVALAVTAVTASAFEADATVADYAKVLEYFEEQTLVNYDFTGGNVDYSASYMEKNPNNTTEAWVADNDAPFKNYLSITIKERTNAMFGATTDNHTYFGWTSDTAIDDFNIDMTVSGNPNVNAKFDKDISPKIVVVVGKNKLTDLSTAANEEMVTIASIDYRGGYFTYLKAVHNADGTVTSAQQKTDFAIQSGSWYTLSLTYDADAGVSITVTDVANAENTITVTDGYAPYAEVKDVRVGAHGTDNGTARGSVMKFANVRILSGVYHRDVENMQADVEAAVLGMYALFNDNSVSMNDRIQCCEVVKQIVAYGFTTENADVQNALDELGVGAFGLYNSKIEQFVGSVDTLGTYAEKKALADETGAYAESLAAMDLSDATAEMLERTEKNLTDFATAKAKVEMLEANSLEFIALVESVKEHSLNDYTVVSADLAALNAITPDLTYDGVAEAYKHYNKIVKAEADIRTDATAFINAVNTANDSTLDFNTRADAYTAAEKCYFDNETYPGVTEAKAIFVDVLVPFMELEISNAENFIKYVNKADYALYIPAKQENLAIAKSYMDVCRDEFEGVAEAKLLYAEVERFVNEQLANAKAYVDAVSALDGLSGNALLNAIKVAEELQKTGNITGVAGVTDANVKLNQTIADLELKERYCIHFINLVASLDKATSVSETYSILAEAKDAESYASNDYAGVTEASAKLSKAITELNAQVEAINAEFEKANEIAANACGLGETSNTVSGKVIALIKKVFGED